MKLKWVKPEGKDGWVLFVMQWACLFLGVALLVKGIPYAWILLAWFVALSIYRNRTIIMDNLEQYLTRNEKDDGGEDE